MCEQCVNKLRRRKGSGIDTRKARSSYKVLRLSDFVRLKPLLRTRLTNDHALGDLLRVWQKLREPNNRNWKLVHCAKV